MLNAIAAHASRFDKSKVLPGTTGRSSRAGLQRAAVEEQQTLPLGQAAQGRLTVPLTARRQAANAALTVRLSAPRLASRDRSYALGSQAGAARDCAAPPSTPLAKGESLTPSNALFADRVRGTGADALSVGISTAIDAAALSCRARTAIVRVVPSRSRAEPLPLLLRQRLAREENNLSLTVRSTGASATRIAAASERQGSTVLRSVVGPAATTFGSMPMSPTSSRARANAVWRARWCIKLALDG